MTEFKSLVKCTKLSRVKVGELLIRLQISLILILILRSSPCSHGSNQVIRSRSEGGERISPASEITSAQHRCGLRPLLDHHLSRPYGSPHITSTRPIRSVSFPPYRLTSNLSSRVSTQSDRRNPLHLYSRWTSDILHSTGE